MTNNNAKIAIGCPVRNRAWVLPDYLEALRKIEYNNGLSHGFLFLENDSTDDTLLLLAVFAQLYGAELCTKRRTTSPGHRRGEYNANGYAHLAAIRNLFINMFLQTDADYLFSVDSDVIVSHDILQKLLPLADQQTIVGAAISNIAGVELDGRCPGNFMIEQGGLIMHPAEYPLTGSMAVDVIGACYLIPRSVLEAGVRYGAHAQGEDVEWCRQAKDKGFRMLVSFDTRPEHRMEER